MLRFARCLVCLALTTVALPGHAQSDYPNKPIMLVVPEFGFCP